MKLQRRAVISALLALAGGSVASRWLGLARALPEVRELPHADWPGSGALGADERATLLAAVDAILPPTDTPGAAEAGVPGFIEFMLQDEMSRAERDDFIAGLKALGAERRSDVPFARLPREVREEVLLDLESEASDADWYAFGKLPEPFAPDSPFICRLKALTIFGFFTSELGCTRVLRSPALGGFDGDVLLERGQTSWFPVPYF